ncbi:toxic anion resistance protein [Microbispora sp. RL4-1S]|uniref:Toxic anion resistance protein n=2 Tax=Microbispora oryzae TaxID=2806554 RepID=A0A941AHG4_9ACTN|nr:toxic anion resistance protein [Microbispora oryzae]
MLPMPDERSAELARRAAGFAGELAGLDHRSPEFGRKVHDITAMGDAEIRASSQVANRMLKRPVAALASARGEGADAQALVAGQLVALRRTIVDLDPKQASSGTRRLLGLIPFGDRLRDYFAKYQSAQKHIDDIVRALASGQDELRKDNAAIEGEKANLWESMTKLQEYAVLAAALDAALEERIAAIEPADPDRATALKSDALFGVRQKHQDLLTQLAVSAQGYLALDLVRRNNLELIKGVDRATTTTIAALRTAVTVAQALANQKLVLDQITALNATTSDLILATSEMLRTQAGQIQTQAASTSVSMETLSRAFDNVYSTMDMIDGFKAKAVENMAVTVDSLTAELDHARAFLERARRGDEAAAS